MKTTLSALATALVATTAAAHPGHDHSYTVGGESHHVLWIVVGVAVGAFAIGGLVTWAVQRKRSR